MRHHWLVKSEPDAFSWEQQAASGVEPWTGVRNATARNNLAAMRLGDLASLVGAGVGLGFIVFFLNEFCGALGSADVIPEGLAAWSPPLLALLAGVTLLCYTEDG